MGELRILILFHYVEPVVVDRVTTILNIVGVLGQSFFRETSVDVWLF